VTASVITSTLLTISSLNVRFRLPDATVHAVTDISLTVAPGELLAVVGESGCGKSVLAHALLGLLPANATVTGTALLHGGDTTVDLLGADDKTLARAVRGRRIGLVPQSPATALTPVRTGRHLLEETLRAHGRNRQAARVEAETAADGVGLTPADLDLYPHELSGGMAQRLATALALAPDPPLVLADEPTSGLDRPLVDATLDLLRARCDSGAAVILISHDLAAAQRVADTVAVMYASRVVEHRPAAEFFAGPRHPYAHALLDALPDRAFAPIPGHPPMLTALPAGCAFAPRCPYAAADCGSHPGLDPDGRGRLACHSPIGDRP
jgi:peptide/nickel transport system ATP-binding protein